MGLTVYAGNEESLFVTNRHAVERKQDGEKKTGENGDTIFAGNLNLVPDIVSRKRAMAQRQAMKIVGDAFASEQKLDQSVEEIREKQQMLHQENKASHTALKEIEQNRADLMESYGVTEDSQEQKDLELLRKERDSLNVTSGVVLSQDEKDALEEIHRNGVTEYQKSMLELDDCQELYQKSIKNNENAIDSISKSLTDIELDRLKTRPILAATKQATKILEEAEEEIIGQLRGESLEYIDEKREKEEEKQEEIQEEKEQEEEEIKEAEKKKAQMEAQIAAAKQSGTQKASSSAENPNTREPLSIRDVTLPEEDASVSKAEKEVEKLMKELNLLMEDIKGAAVDTTL